MQLHEGHGWRLVWDPSRSLPLLLGGQGWAAEFSSSEALLLLQGAQCLREQRSRLLDQLLEQEELALEWESAGLWLAAEGDRCHWALRFVLQPENGQRGLEAGWAPEAVEPLLAALETLAGQLGHGAAAADR